MNRRTWILSALSALLGYAADGMAQTPAVPFRIGVAPHTSTRVIIEMYQPLRLFLEKALERPVEIVTAADFTEYARRAVQQQYDLAITTSHQARMLESDSGYLPLLTYKADFKAVALVEASSRYREPKDLAGTTAIGLSPSSLVTSWGRHWLLRNSVSGVNIRFVSASDSVAQLLLAGDGSIGFTSLANYQSLVPAVRDRLRILAESLPMAGRVYALNRRNASQKEKISAALWAFAETDEARQYFDKYRLDGYRRLEPRELTAMEPYANEVRQALKREK